VSEFDVSDRLKATAALRLGKLPLISILSIFTDHFHKQHLSNSYPFMGKHLSFCDAERKLSVVIRYISGFKILNIICLCCSMNFVLSCEYI
jgi:hypothetical protein